MQFGSKPSPGVVFDSAMGNHIDDPLALALLYGLQGKGESRVAAVTTSKPCLSSAAFCDLLVRFYTGDPGPFGVPAAIGMATAGTDTKETPLLAAPLANPTYVRGVRKLNDTADPLAVIRNALTAQFDRNAIVVMTGEPTNLAGFLALPDAKDLIRQKVRLLATTTEPPAGWPGPVAIVPKELGDAVPFPAAALLKEFAWAPQHPIADAWRAADPALHDAPSAALAAALYAARPDQGYFKLSNRTLTFDPAQKDRVLQAYVELAATKPVPRRGRRG
jgi:hypothetical protein